MWVKEKKNQRWHHDFGHKQLKVQFATNREGKDVSWEEQIWGMRDIGSSVSYVKTEMLIYILVNMTNRKLYPWICGFVRALSWWYLEGIRYKEYEVGWGHQHNVSDDRGDQGRLQVCCQQLCSFHSHLCLFWVLPHSNSLASQDIALHISNKPWIIFSNPIPY